MGNALPLIARAMNLFKVACIVLEKPMNEQGLSVLGLYPLIKEADISKSNFAKKRYMDVFLCFS